MTEYPENDRQAQLAHQTQPAGSFLDWLLTEKGYHLARYDDDDLLRPVYVSVQDLLAEWAGLDLTKVETERRQMIEANRQLNEKRLKDSIEELES